MSYWLLVTGCSLLVARYSLLYALCFELSALSYQLLVARWPASSGASLQRALRVAGVW